MKNLLLTSLLLFSTSTFAYLTDDEGAARQRGNRERREIVALISPVDQTRPNLPNTFLYTDFLKWLTSARTLLRVLGGNVMVIPAELKQELEGAASEARYFSDISSELCNRLFVIVKDIARCIEDLKIQNDYPVQAYTIESQILKWDNCYVTQSLFTNIFFASGLRDVIVEFARWLNNDRSHTSDIRPTGCRIS